MRQFFLATEQDRPWQVGQTAQLDPQESHHLRTVLRGGRESLLQLTDGWGRRYTARPLERPGRAVAVEILDAVRDESEFLPPRLILALAVVKGNRFEWALEKAVELGAHAILPLATDHGVVEPGGGKFQRWEGVLRSALKQSGRSWLPTLSPQQTVDQVLAAARGPLWFGAAPGESDPPSPDGGQSRRKDGPCPDALTVFIGPEGGWSARERDLLAGHRARPLRLGPHVLRTETAAAAALAVLQQIVLEHRRGLPGSAGRPGAQEA